jgi:short-subunit dehydrogenase
MAGKAGVPGVATYCGTKHFVVGVTEATYPELQDTGVALSYVCPGIVNTELTSGVQATRGAKVVEPQDVANAVLEALQFQKVDHIVPKAVRGIYMVTGLLPRKAREFVGKAMKADKIMLDIDAEARQAYIDRTTGAVAIGKQAETKEKVGR